MGVTLRSCRRHISVSVLLTHPPWGLGVFWSYTLISHIVVPHLLVYIGQSKFLQFIEFLNLVSTRKIVVLSFHPFNIGNGRHTWMCQQFSRAVSTRIDGPTLRVSTSIFMFMLFWTIGLENILVSKGDGVFTNSLLGATIQDGGKREAYGLST